MAITHSEQPSRLNTFFSALRKLDPRKFNAGERRPDKLEQALALKVLLRQLHRAPRRALILNYDGTLAPLRANPDKATPYPGIRERLDSIMRDPGTRLVIVSGRWTKDLVPILGLKRTPEIWGSGGSEQLREGNYAVASLAEATVQGLVLADDWARQIEREGGRCERKPGSLAIHWRGLSARNIGTIRRLLRENWEMHQLQRHLSWVDFDGGIELRAPGRGKGYAVASILRELGDAPAVYLGDDRTDEDAFQAIRGRGVGVLVREQYRPTAAEVWLQPPQDVLDFLTAWQRACEGNA